jgi:tetratricopeptide (TPR) repeat protein/TolB-like protein
MECPKCHSTNAPEASHCLACGAALSPGPSGPDLSGTEALPSLIVNLVPGSIFAGRYRIAHEIARGGMGVVYKAEDVKLKRAVALKFLPWWLTSEPTAKERFIHEAQAASALDHTNICTIYEVDETADGQMFMAMAYCEGETLRKKVERGPLDVARVLDIAIQACDGLGAAHDTGLVHRDIKPANIMVNEHGHVKIVDFGLAKLAGQTRLTRAGTAVGTAGYMSPEQARGDDVDGRTDIWSLGVVIYEMLTGQLPFKGESEQAIIHSILNEPPEPPSTRNKNVPAGLEAVVLRCLRKTPAERFATVDDLQTELVGLRKSHRSLAASVGVSASGRILRRSGALGRGAWWPVWTGSAGRRVLLCVVTVACVLVGLALVPPASPIINLRAVAQRLGITGLPAGKLVAVLPLSVAGGDPGLRALADGLIQTQTRKMTWVDGFTDSLWVVPAGEVVSAKVAAPHEARDALGANLAIAGSLELADDAMSLALDLVDTDTGSRLKHRVVRDPIANLSTWQDSIPVVMARMLEVTLPADRISSLRVGGTTVPSAYRSYLVGSGYLSPLGGQQNLDSAAVWIERAMSEDPFFAMACAALGEVYLEKLRATEDTAWASAAVACCRRAIQMEDRLSVPYTVLGHVDADLGRLDQAVADLERAVAIDSNYAESYNKLAVTYRQMGRPDDAVTAIKHWIRTRPKDYRAYNWLGFVYLGRGDYEDAIKPLRVSISLVPRNPNAFNYLGTAYFNLERWREAEEMFTRSIEIEPRYAAYSNLGTISFYRGQYADAARMYKKALDMSGNDYKLWGNYAESCYWGPGQKETGLAIFRTAVSLAEKQLEKDSSDIVILADLASYLSMIGERARALAYLDRVTAANPNDAAVMVRVAETYEGLGDRQQAIQWVERAMDAGWLPTLLYRYPGLRSLWSDPGFNVVKRRGAD